MSENVLIHSVILYLYDKCSYFHCSNPCYSKVYVDESRKGWFSWPCQRDFCPLGQSSLVHLRRPSLGGSRTAPTRRDQLRNTLIRSPFLKGVLRECEHCPALPLAMFSWLDYAGKLPKRKQYIFLGERKKEGTHFVCISWKLMKIIGKQNQTIKTALCLKQKYLMLSVICLSTTSIHWAVNQKLSGLHWSR